jgi:hypothetical protein
MKIFNYALGDPALNSKILGSNADGTTGNYSLQSIIDFMSDIMSPEYIVSYSSYDTFPLEGVSSTLYIAEDTYATYAWDNGSSSYVQLSAPPVDPNTIPDEGDLLFADIATVTSLKSCTYNNGTAGVGATLIGVSNGQLSESNTTNSIDGVTTALNQVVLVKNQADAKQNGLYTVTTLGNGSTQFVLTRIEEADSSTGLYPLQVNVNSGVTNGQKYFIQTSKNPVIGTTNIAFNSWLSTTKQTEISFVHTATDEALPTCTYASGSNVNVPGYNATLTATANGALGAIGGFTIANGTRILVKNQSNSSHNGDYTVTSKGSATTPWKLTRLTYWASGFNQLYREFKVNSPLSDFYGNRYSASTSATNATIGSATITIYEAPTAGGIPAWLEYDGADLTIWNNGHGNVSSNTSYGESALASNTDGGDNTAIGLGALMDNQSGVGNTALGSLTLRDNVSNNNTAIGSGSLTLNVDGFNNTAVGNSSLHSNNDGTSNTAIGSNSLASNISGNANTAIGKDALTNNTADNNTAIGTQALQSNTDGTDNVAIGLSSMSSNDSGSSNVAVGAASLGINVDGTSNTAIGSGASALNLNAGENVAIGYNALYSNQTGYYNVVIGSQAAATNLNSCIVLGRGASANASYQLVIGSETNPVGTGTNSPTAFSTTANQFTGGSALPALAKYLSVRINGTFYKIPLFL